MTSSLRSAPIFVATLAFLPAANASSPVVDPVVVETTTRQQRPFSLAVGASSFSFQGAFIGPQARCHLTDRLSLSVQVATAGVVAGTVNAGARYFLLAWPTSGVFFDATAHLGDFSIKQPGAVGEVGWEYRGRWGLLFDAGVGLAAWRVHETQGGRISRYHWGAFHVVSLRLGYAF